MAIGKLVKKDGKLLYSTGDLWSADDATDCNCDCDEGCPVGCKFIYGSGVGGLIGGSNKYYLTSVVEEGAQFYWPHGSTTGSLSGYYEEGNLVESTFTYTEFGSTITLGTFRFRLNARRVVCSSNLPLSRTVEIQYDFQAGLNEEFGAGFYQTRLLTTFSTVDPYAFSLETLSLPVAATLSLTVSWTFVLQASTDGGGSWINMAGGQMLLLYEFCPGT